MAHLNSLFVISTLFLIATITSNCPKANGQIFQSIILGQFTVPRFLPVATVGQSTILSCDEGRTSIAPPVATKALGLFEINVGPTNASLVDASRCAVFVKVPPRTPNSSVITAYRAPLTLFNGTHPVFSVTRLFVAGSFTFFVFFP